MSTSTPYGEPRGRARRRTWSQDPEGRRIRILDAGAHEFAREGYRGARMDRVAKAAGVSEGTIYHRFGSKQGLLIAVGDQYGKGLAKAAFGGLGDELHPRDIERVVRNIFDYVRKTDAPLAAFLLASDPTEGGPAMDANRNQMIAAIVAFLERAIEQEYIRPVDPRVSAEIQYGLVESALRECFLRKSGADEEVYIREVTACLTGYMAPAS